MTISTFSRGFCFPFRYYVMLLTATSTAFMFASRCVINVAILAMVTIESNSTQSVESSEQKLSSSAPTFDWNSAQQGVIIGSYHYSYTLLQISSGFLADKFDAVKLSCLGHFFATIAMLAFPLAAQVSYGFAITLRVIHGLFHAPIFPCCYVIFEKWFNLQEKAFAIAIMSFAYNFGTAAVMPVTAWLCNNGFAGGWPSAFYCMGIANFIYLVIFYTTVTSNPNDSLLTSESEKIFIANHVVQTPKRKTSTPWKSIFTSIPLWSVTIARGIGSIAYNVVNSRIPLYLETVLGYTLQKNGLINSAFYLIDSFGQLLSGPLSRYIASKNYLNLTVTRKLFESIALLGPATFLISIPFLSGQANIIILGLMLTMFTCGFSTGGDIPIVPEMAPGMVGTVFGFSNTLSCAAGFISPMTVGYILDDQVFSEYRWNLVFFIFGGLQIAGIIQFAVFATAKPQPWALTNSSLHHGSDTIDANAHHNNKDIEMNDKSVRNSNQSKY